MKRIRLSRRLSEAGMSLLNQLLYYDMLELLRWLERQPPSHATTYPVPKWPLWVKTPIGENMLVHAGSTNETECQGVMYVMQAP